MRLLRHAVAALCLAVAGALPVAASAAEYPSQPIRLIVPYAPGGFVDITSRTISPALSKELGQQVVVENRTGAGGALGVLLVGKAAPDGYTVVMTSGQYMVVAPLLYPKTATFSRNDFTPIALVSGTPLILVLGPRTKLASVKELIEFAKAKPGTLTMGSAGQGTSNHLTGELFRMTAGIDFVHAPYKGSGEALNDLTGGHIDFLFDQIPASIGFVRSGAARALAVASQQRSPQLPDVPTFAELGMPGVEAKTLLGIWAPGGTPAAIAGKLNAAINKVLQDPATRDAILKTGAEPQGGGASEFAAVIEREDARWTQVIRSGNIKVDQ